MKMQKTTCLSVCFEFDQDMILELPCSSTNNSSGVADLTLLFQLYLAHITIMW